MNEKLVGNISFGDRTKQIGILPYQYRVHKALSKNWIVLAIWGYSGGKTYVGARELVLYTILTPGGLSWILVPVYDLGLPTWEETKRVLYGISPDIIVGLDEKPPSPTITLATGAKIQLKTGDDPDLLRNFAVNFLLVEEAQKVKEDAWSASWSRVAKTGGKALIIETQPKDPNHWTEKMRNTTDKHISVIDGITTKDNKALTKEQVKMFYSIFKGDYMLRELEGERIFNQGAIYNTFKENEHTFDDFTPTELEKIENAEKRLFIGIDFGWDKPTGVILALYCKWKEQETLFVLDELYGRFWGKDKLKQEIKEMEKRFFDKFPQFSTAIPKQMISSYGMPVKVPTPCPIFRTGDPKQPDKIYELSSADFMVEVAPFGFFGREPKEETVKEVYNWLFLNKIYVSRKLTNLIDEFRKWIRKPNGSPIDDHDHLLDALRQIVALILIQNKYSQTSKRDSFLSPIMEDIQWR
jgi:hypothetical protein